MIKRLACIVRFNSSVRACTKNFLCYYSSHKDRNKFITRADFLANIQTWINNGKVTKKLQNQFNRSTWVVNLSDSIFRELQNMKVLNCHPANSGMTPKYRLTNSAEDTLYPNFLKAKNLSYTFAVIAGLIVIINFVSNSDS